MLIQMGEKILLLSLEKTDLYQESTVLRHQLMIKNIFHKTSMHIIAILMHGKMVMVTLQTQEMHIMYL